MLKTLRKNVMAPAADRPSAQTTTAGHTYVQTALLECPGSVARLATFWEPPKLFGFSGKAGLKQVVADAAYSDGKRMLAPHHVLVELSEGVLAHDRRTGGHLGAAMASTLAQLHQSAFADNLPEGTQARYRVVAAPDLPMGTVRVRLGAAIYVPEAGEDPQWQVQLSLDAKSWDSLPAVNLQAEQRLFIVSGSADHGSVVCPAWPFEPQVGLVMLNVPGEPELDFSAEPLRSLEFTHNPQANWTVVRRAGAAPDAPCLYLRAKRLAAAAQTTTSVAKAEAGIAATASPAPQPGLPMPGHRLPRERLGAPARIEPTLDSIDFSRTPVAAALALHTADNAVTYVHTPPSPHCTDAQEADNAPTIGPVAPVRSATLALHGLALQRPSLFAAAGVQGLGWALNARGHVLPAQHPDAALCFEITARDELRLLTHAGPRVLPMGEALPLAAINDITRLQPLPAPLNETCIGWLSLPPVTLAPVPAGRDLVVGRQADALKALRPLAGTGHLVALPGVGGDRMGLSRQHAELRLTDDGLAVRAIGLATLAVLDAEMRLLTLVSQDQPALLNDGQHLVLGHYIWRFNA